MKKIVIYILFLFNVYLASAQYHDTTGEVTVDGSGSVSYKIPIVVPPGIKNISPQVTLNYSSSSSNGIAGYGWNLMGISSINRIGTRIDIDGYIDPVNFNNNDQFALDGQRLIKQTDNTFRTENYSNLKITINNNDPLAPDYFIVHAADGSKSYYGNTSNAKGIADWLITKWVDVHGNTISYEYYKETNVINISKITWAENEIIQTGYKNTIEFNYKNKLRPESAFLHGNKLINKKILDNIIVNTNERQFKKYVISYSKNELNYEMVSSVTEYNSNNEATNPVNFKYNTTTPQIIKSEKRFGKGEINSNTVIRATGDFDGDGKLDAIIGSQIYFNLYGEFEGNTTVKDFNINGNKNGANNKLFLISSVLEKNRINQKNYILIDSHKDFVESNESSTQTNHEVYIDLYKYETNNFTSAFRRTFSFPHLGGYVFLDATNCGNYQSRYDELPILKYIEGDFNGDGISELLVLGMIKNKQLISRGGGGYSSYRTGAQNESFTIPLPPVDQICVTEEHYVATPTYLVDLNENISDANATKQVNLTFAPPYYDENYETFVFDYNGDGKQDLFFIRENGNYYIVSLNNPGNSFESLASGNILEYRGINKNLIFGDYNGDSKTDILIPTEKNNTSWALYLSTGVGLEKSIVEIEKYEESGSGKTYNFNDVYYPLDINGDGKSDLVRVRLESHKNDWSINNTDSFYEIKFFSNIASIDGNPTFSLTNEYHSGNRSRPFPGMPLVGNFKSHSANYQLMIMRDDTDANTELDVFDFKKNQQTDSRVVEITEANDLIKHRFQYQRLDKDNTVYKSVSKENYPFYEMEILPETYVVSKQFYEADNNSKYRLFQYRGLISHYQGLGTLGFKKVAQSGWINDAINGSNPTWQVNEMNPQLKGANIKSWSFIGNNLALIDSFIDDQLLNKTEVKYLFNTLADKRSVLVPTETIGSNFLTGVIEKNTTEYDDFYNVKKQIATSSAQGKSFVKTDENTYYDDVSANPYIVGRLISKKETVSAYNDTYTKQVDYTYENNEIAIVETTFQDSGKSKIEYEYDTYGNVIQVSDYGNYFTQSTTPRIIKSKYDPTGRFVIEKIDIDNFSEFLEYNFLGQVTKQTDVLGVITSSFYDDWGKLIRTELHNAATTPIVTTFAYNRNSSGTSIVKNNLQTLEYAAQYFDIQGRNVKNTVKGFSDGQHISTTIEYNFLGSKIRESEPHFGDSPSLWTTYEYDNLLRLVKMTNSTGLIATNSYNGLEATSTEGVRTKKITKDALDNTMQIIDNGTEVIQHSYYAHGGLKETKYENHVIKTNYDVFARKTYFLDPAVSTVPYTYVYNNFNEVIEENSPETSIRFTYHESGRLLNKKTTGKSNLEVFYSYNPVLKNLLIKEEGTNEGNSFTNTVNYDNYYRISEQTNTTPYFSFKETVNYDAIGRVENKNSVVLKDGQILQNVTLNHQYNTYNGELQLIKDISNGVVGKTIWEVTLKSQRGEAIKQKLGEAIFVEYDFDLYGNLINIRNRNETQWLSNKEYQYQVDRGLLLKRKDTHFNWEENFTYDEFDRLLTWSSPLGTNSNTYIADGRINQNSQVGQYSYNTAAKYKKETIALNENGANYYSNRSTQTVVYDGFKRPLNITEENRGIIDFEYGINSSRIKAVKNNLVTNTKITKYYSPSGTVEISVDKNQNAKIINYLGSPYETPYIYVTEMNLDSKVKANESFYYLGRDFQGSITEVFESDGSFAIERRLFDPWGNVTKLENNVSHNYAEGENAYLVFLDRGYTGHEHFNEVGIIHMNGRIYDPILKQFLSPDNFIQDPSNSQNYNRYGYAWNNPLKYTDPSGEAFVEISFGAAVGIAAAAGAFSYTMVALTTWTEFSALGLIKSATIGAVSGAISFGIGEIMQSVTCVVTAQIQSAVLHGFSQGLINGITGGDFGSSFLSAIVSSVVSSGVQLGGAAAGIKNSGAATILFGTASGALTAKLTNGNVWQAATTAFFVSALNHAMHVIEVNSDSYLDEIAKRYYGDDYREKLGATGLDRASVLTTDSTQKLHYNAKTKAVNYDGVDLNGIAMSNRHIYISDFLLTPANRFIIIGVIGHELIHTAHRVMFGANFNSAYSEQAAYQFLVDFGLKNSFQDKYINDNMELRDSYSPTSHPQYNYKNTNIKMPILP